jgi:hypothetical protein
MEDEVNEIYCALIDNFYFTEEELRLVTDINGWSIETLNDCIYARYRYHSYEQLIERRR